MLFEQNHQTRMFYLDGRAHPSLDVVFFGGHTIAHWEGDTLVADTTNLDGRAYYGVGNTFAPYSRQLHITERFTVMSDKLITFVMTYSFTAPRRVAFELIARRAGTVTHRRPADATSLSRP